MEKREKFAISLRKQKKAQLLETKRRKLAMRTVPLKMDTTDWIDCAHDYSHYFDSQTCLTLLNEVAPDHGTFTTPVSQAQSQRTGVG